MAKFTKQEAISIVHLAAISYQEKLSDRIFRLIYENILQHRMDTVDVIVGDTRCVLSVGFRGTKDGDVPITLKKQSIREVVKKECKVYAIAAKSLQAEQETWKMTYCEHDFSPEKWLSDES